MMDEKIRFSQIELPAELDRGAGIKVYLNGVEQEAGLDYELEDRSIYFFKPVRKEQKLGWWRWMWLFIGVAGSYKQNDSVDVIGSEGGRRLHHPNLPIRVLVEPDEQQKGLLVGSYSPGG